MFVHEFNLTKERQVDVKSKFKRYYGIKKKKKREREREMKQNGGNDITGTQAGFLAQLVVERNGGLVIKR